jgi:hypothetical protein
MGRRIVSREFRLVSVLFISTSLIPARSADAQPYRDGIPSYRILAAMWEQLSSQRQADMTRPLAAIHPLVQELDRKYELDLENRLKRSLDAKDLDSTLENMMALILVDCEDLVASAHRDELTGWRDAKIQMNKALLDLNIIAAALERRQPGSAARITQKFRAAVAPLIASDLTTDPHEIDEHIADLCSEIHATATHLIDPRSKISPKGTRGG